MNKNIKKIIAITSVLMISSCVSSNMYGITAKADTLKVDSNNTVNSVEKLGKYTDNTIKTEGDFQYIVSSETTATIVNYIGSNKNVIFPDKVNGKNVTVIDEDTFLNNNKITSIQLPQYIAVFGVSEKLFEPCTNLQKIEVSNQCGSFKSQNGVLYSFGLDKLICCPQQISISDFVIPTDVTDVCEKAFYNTKNIKSITLSGNIKSISEDAFIGMSNLTKFVMNANSINQTYKVNANGVLFKIDNTTKTASLVKFPQNLALSDYQIENYVIKDANNLTFYTTRICDFAFEGNTHLKTINFKNNSDSTNTNLQTQVIGKNAFDSCTSLSEIVLPKSITTISDFAFNNCSSLKTFEINSSNIAIGNGVFNNCPNLSAINMINSNCSYSTVNGVLYNRLDKTVTDSSGAQTKVSYIELVKCPNKCKDLDASKAYTVDKSVSYIAKYAFQGNVDFKKISLVNSGVKEIQDYAFANCSSLTEITWPASISVLGENAFDGCTSLSEISLPNTILEVKAETFNNCPNLTTLNLSPALKNFNVTALNGCTSLANLKINNITDEKGAFYYTENNVLYMYNSCIPEQNTSTLVKYPIGLKSDTFSIPARVTIIGPEAFKGCTDKGSLKSISLSRPAKSIDPNGEKVLLATTLTDESLTFCYKKYLSSSEIAAPVMIFSDVFDNNCLLIDSFNQNTTSNEYFDTNSNQLTKVLVSNNNSITIPNNITSIKKGAFDNTTIGNLTIPSVVTDMDINDINSAKGISKITFAGNDKYVLGNDSRTIQPKTTDTANSSDNKNSFGIIITSILTGLSALALRKKNNK